MNFNIITLGCKVNQYESQAMREDMLKNGFLLSDDRDRADITIVNSCTVTSVSDAKNRKILNRVRRENPDGIVILTGCMPQAFPEESENFSNCDIVLGNAKRAELVPSIYKFLEEKQKFVHITEHIGKAKNTKTFPYRHSESIQELSLKLRTVATDFVLTALFRMQGAECVQNLLKI